MGVKSPKVWFALGAIGLLLAGGCATSADRPSPVVTRTTATAATAQTPENATGLPAATATAAPTPAPTATGVTAATATSTAIVAATAPAANSDTVGGPQEIGRSAGGRPLLVWRLGNGPTPVVLVGGVHGGYEWNSILLVEQLLATYRANPTALPDGITLHVLPNANPDGLFAVTGLSGAFAPGDLYADRTPGRFNGRGVDLNRNWDCNWSPQALWRDQPVPPGDAPFSEPETQALRDYLLALQPAVVVFYHSAANGVYVSGCPEPDPPSYELAEAYGLAAGYAVYPLFDHYAITGDAGDWLTTQGLASFSVELVSHEALDWEQNAAGLAELLAVVAAPTAATLTRAHNPTSSRDVRE